MKGVTNNVEVIVDLPLDTGESPQWNPVNNCLYWIDVPTGTLYRYALESGKFDTVYHAGQQVGALLVAEAGMMILGLEEGRIECWSEKGVRTLCEGIEEEQGRRFNDGVVDTDGRILLGTMPGKGRGGRLYRFSPDGDIEVLLHDAGQSNGMAFSLDGKILYHTDTSRRTISAYDYGAAPFAGGQTLVKLLDGEGVPDGLAIDGEGHLWSADYGGSKLCRYDGAGTLMSELEMPVFKPTSVAFAGPDLDLMFITSAGGSNRRDFGRYAGSVLLENLGIKGVPPRLAKLGSGKICERAKLY